jgi:hypothetical protein
MSTKPGELQSDCFSVPQQEGELSALDQPTGLALLKYDNVHSCCHIRAVDFEGLGGDARVVHDARQALQLLSPEWCSWCEPRP